jgi:hypothetical protein
MLEKAFLFAKLNPEVNEDLIRYVDSMKKLFEPISLQSNEEHYIGSRVTIEKFGQSNQTELFSKRELIETEGDYYQFPGKLYE